MARLKTYPDLFTHRTRSVLPEGAQRAVRDLSQGLPQTPEGVRRAEACRAALADVPPEAAAHAAEEIRDLAALFHSGPRGPWWRKAPPRTWPLEAGWVILFHGDGRERERALRRLPEPPRSAFEVAALALRMNDWAGPVRAAALAAAERLLPRADAAHLAGAAWLLLRRAPEFGRWSAEAAGFLDGVLRDPRVLTPLRDRLMRETDGPLARVLRALTKRPGFDAHLQGLATGAASPAVRAAAAEMALAGRARWAVGYRRAWVDKSLGRWRRVPDLRERALDAAPDLRTVLEAAAADRAACVRRVAADALIAGRHRPPDWHAPLAVHLRGDPNPGVAARMAFYFRQMAAGA